MSLVDFDCSVLNYQYSRRLREFSNSKTPKAARLFLQAQTKNASKINVDNVSQFSETQYIALKLIQKNGLCTIYTHFDVVISPHITPEDQRTILLKAFKLRQAE